VIIFDLETTCWHSSEKDNISEIIEVGAIKYNVKTHMIEDEMRFYVKPMLNRELSKYCVNKTKISQNDIDCGLSFIFAMEKLNRWIGDEKIVISWGTFNKNQIRRESFLKAYNGDLLDVMQKNYRNLKDDFMKVFNMKQDIGLNKASVLCGLKLNKSQKVLDDIKNMIDIYEVIKEKI